MVVGVNGFGTGSLGVNSAGRRGHAFVVRGWGGVGDFRRFPSTASFSKQTTEAEAALRLWINSSAALTCVSTGKIKWPTIISGSNVLFQEGSLAQQEMASI